MHEPIRRQVTLDAPRSEVWRAITDPAHLEAWFGAGVELDPRPGAPITVRWPDGSTSRGSVELVEPPGRFAFRWRSISAVPVSACRSANRPAWSSRSSPSTVGGPWSPSPSTTLRCRAGRSPSCRRARESARGDDGSARRSSVLGVVGPHAKSGDPMSVRRRTHHARFALADELPVSRQAVAKHLSLLEDAGLVSASAEGRRRTYRLTPGPPFGRDGVDGRRRRRLGRPAQQPSSARSNAGADRLAPRLTVLSSSVAHGAGYPDGPGHATEGADRDSSTKGDDSAVVVGSYRGDHGTRSERRRRQRRTRSDEAGGRTTSPRRVHTRRVRPHHQDRDREAHHRVQLHRRRPGRSWRVRRRRMEGAVRVRPQRTAGADRRTSEAAAAT